MTARCNLCMGALKIFESPWVRPRLLLPKFLIGFCSDRLDPMNVRTKVKFVALPIAEIIRVLKKFGQSLDTPTLLFLLFFFRGFRSDRPVNVSAKFEVRSFTHSWDNRGYSKNFGQSLHMPTLPFSKIFDWLLFRWTLWIQRPKSVALPFLRY